MKLFRNMKMRLDQYLVEKGLAPSRNGAQELIKQGLVLLNGNVCKKSGKELGKDFTICIADERNWVGRGAKKLSEALKRFGIRVQGNLALDIGSSTGGFTQVLLKLGAKKVVAVDVGTRQMHHTLRKLPNVSLMENTDIRDVSSKLLHKFDLVVVDVSFISISKIIKDIEKVTKDKGDIIVLFKPQFEVGREYISKRGLVKKNTDVEKVFFNFVDSMKDLKIQFVEKFDSTLKGKKGNQETFAYFKK
ncbi:TlyA family RNA methyltransferase [Paracoccaceae bacterium]|nr:TlyA family RNA methyltransferase [Paracoccaceae bacterium]